jgi:hypothetical protein
MHCDWAFCYNCLVHVGGGSCSLVVEGSNGSPRFHLFTTINTKGRDRSSLKINTSDVWHVHCVLCILVCIFVCIRYASLLFTARHLKMRMANIYLTACKYSSIPMLPA